MTTRRISESTVRRLSRYLRLLRDLTAQQEEVVSSQELAERSGTTAAQVRKDLSVFGSFGQRGRGYSVRQLERTLEQILGLEKRWRVALVGAGKIGTALLGYGDLAERGFDVVAAFDTDASKIGSDLSGVRVFSMADLNEVVSDRGVEVAIIATPPEAAQNTVRLLEQAGVRGILNFAPVGLTVNEDVSVRTMDVALELEALSFALSSRTNGGRS
ncbi:MAG: redox-sensing transcriptional repressor Rex [Gemmatimonadota bacterium]